MYQAEVLTVCICQHFLQEISALRSRKEFANVDFISREENCEHPPKSWDELADLIGDHSDKPHIILGSCFGRLTTPPPEHQELHLHHLDNCFYLICQKSKVDALVRAGAYLTSPGWLESWRERLEKWGFTHETAQQFFQETAKQIVLLDTGILENSQLELESFANYVGLPFAAEEIGTDFFALQLQTIILQWRNNALTSKLTFFQEKTANYALAFNMLDELTDRIREKNILEGIREIFQTLFAPKALDFYPALPQNADEAEKGSLPLLPEQQEQLEKKRYLIHEQKNGFWLAIRTKELQIGYLNVAEIMFPEHLKRYLALALEITPLSAQTIDRARILKTLEEEKLVLANINRHLSEKNQALIEAQSQIKTLSGIIPICSHCKEIRDDEGYWSKLEKFIEENSEAQISHSICDNCMEEQLKKI